MMAPATPQTQYYKTLAGFIEWVPCLGNEYAYGGVHRYVYGGVHRDAHYNDFIIHSYTYRLGEEDRLTAYYLRDKEHKTIPFTDGADMSTEDWGDDEWHTVTGKEKLWKMLARIDNKPWLAVAHNREEVPQTNGRT